MLDNSRQPVSQVDVWCWDPLVKEMPGSARQLAHGEIHHSPGTSFRPDPVGRG